MTLRSVGVSCCAVAVCAVSMTFGEESVSLPVEDRLAASKPLNIEDRMPIAGATEPVHVHGEWCVHRVPPRLGIQRGTPPPDLTVNEIEPNDAQGSGQLLGSFGTAGDDAVDALGNISAGTDEDEYRINLNKGDILGVAVLREGGSSLDSMVSFWDGAGSFITENDDGTTFLPPESPLPVIVNSGRESNTALVAPASGEYRVRVRAWDQASTGDYRLQLRVFRMELESEMPAAVQTIFLDYDGETIDATQYFGFGNPVANLSPLSSFLGAWGFGPGDESNIIDEINAVVQARLDFLMAINPSLDYDLLNSRDHADPFGATNVSRIIVGGTQGELGIGTIGIAEWIDPGNFSRDDTGVVLLDLLSTNGSGLEIQAFARDPGFSLEQAIGRVVGNIIAHEIGHYIGSWHTQNGNLVPSIMDQGGGNSFIISIPGLGDDGIMGTPDDNPTEFVTDEYETEGIGTGVEYTADRSAVALSTLVAGGCDGDADGNGTVETADIGYVIFRLGDSGVPGTVDGDVDGNGVVDVNDISFVIFRLGTVCP